MSSIRLSGEHPAEGSRSKKKLKKRSQVWDHFEESPDGQKAKCKYCSKILSGNSKGGTSHLKRHLDKCDKRPKGDMNQPLTLDSSDEVTSIGLTQKETCLKDMVKKAILDELPFASEEFQEGWYRHCPMKQRDVEKEICAYYEHEKEKLAIELNNLTSRICFSVDIAAFGDEDFLSLTAHFINADFNLVRKVISFKKLPDESPSSIINVLETCISEWELEEKVFTFIIEKVVCGDWGEFIEGLREKFSPIMLFGGHHIWVPGCRPQLLMRQRSLSLLRSPFRSREGGSTSKFLEVLTTVPYRIDTFNEIAQDMGLSPINESWFSHHSPLLILGDELFKDILNYKEVFHRYNALTQTLQFFYSGICSYFFHWQILELILDISGLLDCAKNEFRTFKHPTSHLYLRNCFEIVDMIAIKKKNSRCGCQDGECRVHDWEYLRDQFVRFVTEVEYIFIVAGVLDPRFKLSFFQYCIEEMGNFIGLEKIIGDYRDILNKVFSEYAQKEADHVSPSLVGTTNTQAHEGNSLDNNTYLFPTTITDRFSQHIRGLCVISELDEYLGEKVIDIGDEDFDLLDWWKQNQSRFPILSKVARDILAVPADVYSVIDTTKFFQDIFEFENFDALEKVDPQLLEAVICSKEWILDREKRDVSEPKN